MRRLGQVWFVLAIGAAAVAGCSHQATPAGSASPSSSAPTSSATTARPGPPMVSVPAQDYLGNIENGRGSTYYFVTPSKKFACAVFVSDHQPTDAECTPNPKYGGSLPANAPKVPDSDAGTKMVTPNTVDLTAGQPAWFFRRADPTSVYSDGTNSAKPLPYGSALTAGGITCSIDEESGISCMDTANHGFTMSATAFAISGDTGADHPVELTVAVEGVSADNVLTYSGVKLVRPKQSEPYLSPDGPTRSAPIATDATIMSVGQGTLCGTTADTITLLPNGRADTPCPVAALRQHAADAGNAPATIRLLGGKVVGIWERYRE